ncbi:MAG: hypothetical protein ACQETR_14095 [Thermodesulfobacteriota bacterium]
MIGRNGAIIIEDYHTIYLEQLKNRILQGLVFSEARLAYIVQSI